MSPIDQIIEQVSAIQAGSGFHLTDADASAIGRVLRGETIVEQEKATVLAELDSARGGPVQPGKVVNDNLLGLTDAAELHIAERRLTSLRMAEMLADPSIVYRSTPREEP